MRRFIFISIFIGTCLLVNSSYSETSYDYRYRNWESFAVNRGNEIIYFRAGTECLENDNILLFFSRDPSECGANEIELFFVDDEKSQVAEKISGLFGELQIDGYIKHNINYSLTVEKGSEIIFITINNFDREDYLVVIT